MTVFYLTAIILGITFQNVIKKPYAEKTNGKGPYFFSLLISFSAMLFFVFTSNGFEWNKDVILYSTFFAVSYVIATVFAVYAIGSGPLSITSLIIAYSLIMPTVYGLVFLGDPFSTKLFIGIVLLVISLFLINKKNSEAPITFRWIIYVILAFVGNGMCSVFQKMEQVAFDGRYKNEFMMIALAGVVVILSVLVLTKERHEIKIYAKAGWHIAIACGIANGVVNLFVMILSNLMPVSVMFPLVSAGGIIITYLISRFFYKEKLTKTQFVGFLTGIASVIFLS